MRLIHVLHTYIVFDTLSTLSSLVLETDPATNEIVWKYQEMRVSDFFSPRISNAQRLPNGNTFINEGWFGRLFEVTRGVCVVWEYVNRYFDPREQVVINAVPPAFAIPPRKSRGSSLRPNHHSIPRRHR